MNLPLITLRRLAIALPIVLVTRIAEEAGHQNAWFNAHVEQDASMHLYWVSNGAVFVITTAVASLLAIARDRIAATIALAWVGFALFGQTVYRLVGTIGDRTYVPGTAVSVLLYLPFCFVLVRAISSECRMPAWVAAAILVAGGIPLYIHAVMVVFQGQRLF